MMKKLLAGLGVGIAILCVTSHVNSAIYTFSQDGYNGGGHISGFFEATDLDSNGQIHFFSNTPFASEVTNFFLSFSGDAIIPDFTHTFSDLYGIVYDIGTDFLGDNQHDYYSGFVTEGMASNWSLGNTGSGFSFSSGYGPTLVPGGIVLEYSTELQSSTSNLIYVTETQQPVPEPATMILFGTGLAGLAAARRRKKDCC